MTRLPLFACLLALATSPAFVAGNDDSHASPYAGEEQRQIKALSDADIEELMRGGGWGFAKAAELNGMPGPRHLLDMAGEIDLGPEQVGLLQAMFDEMNAEARRLGADLVERERRLDAAFAAGNIDEAGLAAMLDGIEKVRRDLRFVHLETHLQTPAILTEEQISRYNVLRGYAADPCAAVPEGHDAEMWRRHNGCQE